MVKTLASIFVSLALIVGISAYDIYTVGKTFDTFTAALESLYDKTEKQNGFLRGRAGGQNILERQKKRDYTSGFPTPV